LIHNEGNGAWTTTSLGPTLETPVTYIDTAAPGQNHRFYRMK
jgi:hypothetical protein